MASSLHGTENAARSYFQCHCSRGLQVLVLKSGVQEETPDHQLDCSATDQDTADLSCLPSWRAVSLHSNNIMQPEVVCSLIAHIALNLYCASLLDRRQSRLTNQSATVQRKSLQACHACPIGVQGACAALTSHTARFLVPSHILTHTHFQYT